MAKLIWQLISFNTVATVAFIAYCTVTFTSLYYTFNPQAAINPMDLANTKDSLIPMWQRGSKLKVDVYLSTSKAPSRTEKPQNNVKIWETEEIIFDGKRITAHPPEVELNFTKDNLHERFWSNLVDNRDLYVHFKVNNLMAVPVQSLWVSTSLVKRLDYVELSKKRYLLEDWPFIGRFVPTDYKIVDGVPASRPEETGFVGYWKPLISLHIVEDWTTWPRKSTPETVLRSLRVKEKRYLPIFYTDQLGLTRDKLIQINQTMETNYRELCDEAERIIRYDGGLLPLKIAIKSMSVAMWQFNEQLSKSIEMQREFGASTKDIDEIRYMLTETSPALLAVTVIVTLLHVFIDFLAFKSDIDFWRNTKSSIGLSIRTVVIDLFCQIVIFLYLLDTDTSLLVLVPSGLGIGVQAWKVLRAHNLLETTLKDSRTKSISGRSTEFDMRATSLMLFTLLPLVLLYSVYSLIFEKHRNFYSWLISSLASSVYAFGFALMTPQLFINYKLKSVAHLPWKFLIYRAINTFIDDLFAFIIRMPTMHRMACFRDDLVFLVYMYQRYTYPVDPLRPADDADGSVPMEKEKAE